MPEKDLFSVQQVHDLTGIPLSTIRKYCFDGMLPSRKIGKTWLIDRRYAYALHASAYFLTCMELFRYGDPLPVVILENGDYLTVASQAVANHPNVKVFWSPVDLKYSGEYGPFSAVPKARKIRIMLSAAIRLADAGKLPIP